MKSLILAGCLAILTCFAAPAKSPLTILPTNGQIEVRHNGHKIMLYACSSNQFKPYVRELYTLRGENVLIDSPSDHKHHHGLMFAVGVNGINFWEEQPDPGVEKPIKLLSHRIGKSPSGLPQASFTQLIHWVAQTNRSLADTEAVALLIEQRTICLTVDEAQNEVAVDWQSDFKVGPNVPKAVLSGSSYFGLGLRFPRSFDHVCHFQNASNAPYPGEKPGDIIQANWTSAQGKIADQDVEYALFGSSKNRGGTPWFYSMVDPFAYLTATQRLYKQPIEYQSGDNFRLSYLLTVYPKSKTAEYLNQRFNRWEKNTAK